MVSFILYMTVFVVTLINITIMQKMDCRYSITLKGKKINQGVIWNLLSGVLALAPVIFIYGYRGLDVGFDTKTYSEYYKIFKNIKYTEIWNTYVEPGYLLLVKISSLFNWKYLGVQLLCGIIFFLFSLLAIQTQLNNKDWCFGVYILFMTEFCNFCDVTRQMIAVCIVMYAFKHIAERNFVKYLIWILFASFFHRTAILTIIFYIFGCDLFKSLRSKIIQVSVILSVIVVMFGRYALLVLGTFNYYTRYLFHMSTIDYSELICLLYIIPEIILVYLVSKVANISEKKEFYLCIFYLQLPFQVCQVYWGDLARISWYNSITRVILIPFLIRNIERKQQRQQWTIIMISWYMLYYIVMYVVLNGHGTYPYKFCFEL